MGSGLDLAHGHSLFTSATDIKQVLTFFSGKINSLPTPLEVSWGCTQSYGTSEDSWLGEMSLRLAFQNKHLLCLDAAAKQRAF